MATFSVSCAIFLVHSKIFRKLAPHYHAILSNIYYLYGPLPPQNPHSQNAQLVSLPSSRTRPTNILRKRRRGSSRRKKQTELFSQPNMRHPYVS